jgi:hypothetical protein
MCSLHSICASRIDMVIARRHIRFKIVQEFHSTTYFLLALERNCVG